MTRREILRDYRNARQLLELESDDSVLYIQRLRIAGDAPLMLENNYYSLKRLGFYSRRILAGRCISYCVKNMRSCLPMRVKRQ